MMATDKQIQGALLKLSALLKFAPNFDDREKLATWTEALRGITVQQITEIFGKFKRECTSWPALSEFRDLMDGGIGEQSAVVEILTQQIISYITRGRALSLEAAEVLAALGGLRGIEWFDGTQARCRDRLAAEIRAVVACRSERLIIAQDGGQKALARAEVPKLPAPPETEPGPLAAAEPVFREIVDSIGQSDKTLESLRRLFGRFVAVEGVAAGASVTDAARDRAAELAKIGTFRAANKTERIEAMKILIQCMERK